MYIHAGTASVVLFRVVSKILIVPYPKLFPSRYFQRYGKVIEYQPVGVRPHTRKSVSLNARRLWENDFVLFVSKKRSEIGSFLAPPETR